LLCQHIHAGFSLIPQKKWKPFAASDRQPYATNLSSLDAQGIQTVLSSATHVHPPPSFSTARAFEAPGALLEVLQERVKWQVQRAMRRAPERLFAAERGYVNDRVSQGEVKRTLTGQRDPRAEQWLTECGVSEALFVEAALARLERTVDERLREVASAATWPTEELRARFGLSNLELDLLVAAAAPRLSEPMSRLYSFAWADISTKQPTASFLVETESTEE